MIINYDSPGQLCNRIWSLIPTIAYGLEYDEKVLIVNFDEYSSYFENLNKNPLISFSSKKLLKRFIHSLKVRGYIQNGRPNLLSKLLGWNMVEGWPIRLDNCEMVESQTDNIRTIFRFNDEITNSVDKVFHSLNNNEIVVGVHIRRGDYKNWLGGIYYYTDEEYISVMDDLSEQFEKENKVIKFLLCSNEPINYDKFSKFDCFNIPGTSGEKDLYALSKCNYIIGPPSSYSQWTSFVGKVPLNYMMSVDKKLFLSDFSDIISFNRFRNGTKLAID